MVHKQSGRGGVLVVLSLALAAGCQQSPRRDAAEPALHLSASQTADVQIAFARTLETRGEEERARATYTEALKQDPKRIDALVRLAVLSDQQGHFRESEYPYRRALAAHP